MRSAPVASPRLGGGVVASTVLHALLIGLVLWWSSQPAPVRPPVYRVELVGQAGPRRAGVETAPPEPSAPAPEVAGAERVAEEKLLPKTSKSKKAAPSPKATPSPARRTKGGAAKPAEKTAEATAPRSGAGATGSKGADVANLRTDGIAFPFPGYLNNIVRQIALEWTPRRVSAALVTEVKFLIRRDGSVAGIEVVKGSGDRLYDLDAMGAVEAAGNARTFGRLPSGWADDVLVVYFTFDYALRPK